MRILCGIGAVSGATNATGVVRVPAQTRLGRIGLKEDSNEGDGAPRRTLRFRSMELHGARPRPVEVDGEPIGDCADLVVRVYPARLLVKVPRWDP